MSNKIKRYGKVGENIYDSNDAQAHNRTYKGLNNRMFGKSMFPTETGIIPENYNGIFELTDREKRKIDSLGRKGDLNEGFDSVSQDSVFSDCNSQGSISQGNKSNGSVLADHMAFFKRGNMMRNNSRFEGQLRQKENNNGDPAYFSQFGDLEFDNPSDPVSSNNISCKTGCNSTVSRLERERDLALKSDYSNFDDNLDMTYGVVNEKDFVHNNMVPFFNRGIGKGYGPNSEMQKKWDDVKQRRVDTFTGSTKNIAYKPKTERRPLFNPHVGMTWIYGMPNLTDYMSSRYIPGRERRNEKIHQPIRVTPGLNKGYNEVNKDGFVDLWRPLPKEVNDLRAANNPKITYGRPVIPGMKGHRRGIISNVAKNNPETFWEQDPRDFVKSLGYYRAPSIYGNFNAPSTNRQMTTRAWYGPAHAEPSIPRPDSMYPYFKRSLKENFKGATPRNITGVEWKRTPAFDMISNIPDPTLRNETEDNTWLNAAKPKWNQGIAFDMVSNIPDPTLRNLTELRTQYNPVALHEGQKTRAFDMVSNIPDPTLRNLTENRTQYNPVTLHEGQKTQAFDMVSNIPDPTLRNITELRTQYNPVTLHEGQKTKAFDMVSNIPDPTLRNLTEKITQYRPVALHEGFKPQAFDMVSNIPDPTLRNTTEIRTQYNPVTLHEGQKTRAFDMVTNIPDPTLRNTTEIRTQYNPVALHQGQRGPAFDMVTNIPDPTLRNLTQNVTQYKPVVLHEGQRGPAFDMVSNIPDPTLRNTTEIMTQYRPVSLHEGFKGPAFDMVSNIPDPTLRNVTEKITQYNPATLHEGYKGPAFDMVSNIPDPTLRNLTEKVSQLNPAGTEWEKGIAFDMISNIPDPTMRNLTENVAQLNPAKTAWDKGVAFDMISNIPDPTLRNLTEVKTYYNPVTLHEGQKNRARDDAWNSLVNVTRDDVTVIRDGGAPTLSNYNKTPTYEHTMVQLCEPIQVNRDLYGNMSGQRPLQCIPTMHTRIPNVLPQHSWRFDTCITENLKNNPFINNTQHKAVAYKAPDC